MPQLSSSALEKARKAHGAVLQAFAEPGTARNIAQVLGTSEATVSRTKATLEDAITLLYHAGFKVVSADMHCYPEDYVKALHTMAKMQMQSASPSLEWD